MRRVAALAAAFAFAFTATAQVKLLVRRDGKKVIYNVGSYGRGGDYSWLAKQRNRRTRFDALIERYASDYNVDPVLVRAVIQVESDFNPQCVSNKGARGLMQLIPETARRYGVRSIFDPAENIRGGVHYLADLMALFNNDVHRALAAYNAGEGAVSRYGGIPPYEETTTYVRRALTVYYGRPYGGGETIAGHTGPKLRGGFGAAVLQPIITIPRMKYLGTE
jgi:soluble lytic murein transglycosylase-like protein